MIPNPGPLSALGHEAVRDLLSWRPEHGVFSLYIRFDPGSRSPAWTTEVRNGLSGAVSRGAEALDREGRQALEATAERLERDLCGGESPRPEAAGLIGFVEVARKPAEQRWYAVQVPPHRTEVLHGAIAQVHALLEVLDDGAPLGVAAVSSERVRLLDWRLGQAQQLHDWELEFFGEDWRERKAQRPRDPAKGEGVSASGRDQYNQRLEANRERFAHQTGDLAQTESKQRDWQQLLVFGDKRYVRGFAEGFGDAARMRHLDGADLASEPTPQIERRVEEMLPELNRDRERSLIERIKEAAYAEGRSSLGVQETLQALQEGRVEHLVYDAEREYSDVGLELDRETASNGVSLIERMVELALSTSARVTPVEGESAEALGEQGGVIALLRY